MSGIPVDPRLVASLRRAGLLPPAFSADPATVGLVSDAGINRRSKSAGALLGGAIGDALGRPAEGRSRQTVQDRYGELRDFVRWSGWRGGPSGTFTDDTQLTVCVAESIIAGDGGIDPADLAGRFVEWLPVGRGKGAATTAAVSRLAAGVAWHDAGEASAGNGAAMRVAPVGLVHRGDPDRLRGEAALSALITHAHPMAVASAIAQAFLTSWCVHRRPGTLDPGRLMSDLAAAMEDVHDPGEPGTWPGAGPSPVRLADRLGHVVSLLDLTPDEAFDELYNGAFVLESMPAALWCFLRSPEDAEKVIVTAASGGRDADTVAAMAGTLAGAYLGEEALPRRWRADLEDAGRIADLADRLHDLAERRRQPTVGPGSPAATGGPDARSRILGCLLAGAVGDALGAPVEFDSLPEIRRRHGPEGVRSFEPAYGRRGAITDDTQMTLFTAEALLRAEARLRDRGPCDVAGAVRRAYLRWLATQGEADVVDPELAGVLDGWLFETGALHHRRAPGSTCVSALRMGGQGTPGRRLNDSKGCGGVMRVAPVGLVARDPFTLGAEAAAITHGHPSGHLAAGALAAIIGAVVHGRSLLEALDEAMDGLRRWPGHEETLSAVQRAIGLSHSMPVRPETVERLGAGWVAEEALAIGVYAALVAPDLASGLTLAVTHSGDSDSTGAIAGNLLGAALGADAVPAELIQELEAREIITTLGNDLGDVFVDGRRPDPMRYPSW